MDLNLNYSDDENPLSLKSDFILSLCELIVGGKDGLMPVEKTIIDAVCAWCTGIISATLCRRICRFWRLV